MTTETKRAGMTIDAVNFKQGVMPFWPDKFKNASLQSWVGQAAQARAGVMQILQKRHDQNEMVRVTKGAGKQPILPEPDVRAKLARAQQRHLADIHHKIGKLTDEVFLKRASLRPVDFSSGTMVDAINRQELRTLLRAMKPEDRERAMRRYDYRSAALEQPAEASGLPPSMHERLTEETLRAKFPADMAGIDDAQEAVEILRETLKPAYAAVEAELIASGTTVAEPTEAPATPTWA